MEAFDRHRYEATGGPESIQLSCITTKDRCHNGGLSGQGIVIAVGESTGIRRFGQYSDVNHLNGILTHSVLGLETWR